VTAPICRDLGELTPCFRQRAELLLERLARRGYRVQVWETLRTQARVNLLAARGTGSKRSVHRWGAALDIVEEDKTPWVANQPGLWEAIGEEAERLGLVWGGRFSTRSDRPHVQALDTLYDRQLARVPAEQRDAWVRERMRPPKAPERV
jgi:peptidoglycan L-alanyl-D-glutamate endopeptidase CwlK